MCDLLYTPGSNLSMYVSVNFRPCSNVALILTRSIFRNSSYNISVVFIRKKCGKPMLFSSIGVASYTEIYIPTSPKNKPIVIYTVYRLSFKNCHPVLRAPVITSFRL